MQNQILLIKEMKLKWKCYSSNIIIYTLDILYLFYIFYMSCVPILLHFNIV